MMVWGVLTSIMSLAAIAGVIFFAPLELRNEKLNVEETRTRLKGSFRAGFTQSPFYSTADAYLYEVRPRMTAESALTDNPAATEASETTENSAPTLPDAEEKIVIFLPNKRGDTEHYKPYLQLLAQKGFTVYSADFFADDCRWLHSFEDMKILRRTAMVARNELQSAFFASQREFYTYNISLEIGALLEILSEKYGTDCAYYFVSDVMGDTAISDLTIKQKSKIKGSFFLDSEESYTTPGFGFIRQTDPILAFYKKLEKDRTFKEARILAEKTADTFTPKQQENFEEETEEDDGTGAS